MKASYSDLRNRHPIFANTTYSDIVLIETLRAQSNLLDLRLLAYFAAPISIAAQGALTFSGNPGEGDAVTAGGKTYTFAASPASENDVDIGTTKEISAANLNGAMNQSIGTYHADTTVNTDAESVREGAVLTLSARKEGPGGNDTALSTTSAQIVVTGFSGGLREFPVLVAMNLLMATCSLLAGKSVSKISGGGNTSKINDYKELLKDSFEVIIESGILVDTTGAVLESASMCPISDTRYPSVDMGDPAFWATDPERRDWDRN